MTNEANEVIHKTVDASGKIVKTVSGEGGLVGKAIDASSKVIKGVSTTGKNAVDRTVDTSSNFVKGAKNKVFHHQKKD